MTTARAPAWDAGVLLLAMVAATTADSAVWTWLSALVLATLGLGHGAFDVDIERGSFARRTVGYLWIAAATLGLWFVAPSLALVAFLAASVWHFGQAELVHRTGLRCPSFGFLSRGLLLVGLPLLTYPAQAEDILRALGVPLSLATPWAPALALLCVVQHLGWIVFVLPRGARARELLSVAPSIVLLTTQPLLVGFTLTFALGHSVAHLHAVVRRGLPTGAFARAGAFWLAALVGGVVLASSLGMADDRAGRWASVFMLLSALTMPHMLVVERWHRRREH